MKNILIAIIVVIVLGGLAYYAWSPRTATPEIGINSYSTTTNTVSDQKPTTETSSPIIKESNNMKHLVTIKTNLGEIKFETYDGDAPKTVENFIKLANEGFYNGVIFHRVIDGFMIQGGDPTGLGSGGPGYTFADELNPATESYKNGYKKGVVAMANAGPNTNGSQFFIMVADYPLPNNYTIFGKVISGQDVADKISLVPRGDNDKPLSPVTMESVTVENN